MDDIVQMKLSFKVNKIDTQGDDIVKYETKFLVNFTHKLLKFVNIFQSSLFKFSHTS